ncbi:MAG: penicillin acylase family protein, partial [Acidimicrobiales bacterium]|nr:penicillin acylase family protein [Acidimicrobiales bacterium]
SATPNLSEGALADYETALEANPIVKIAADNGAILLNGSDPVNEWVDEQGARDPGLVPYKEQPQVSRDDYVFNANDSFWMAHATEFLTGDYSPLHGRQETARSPRTRENATVLDDTTASGASGEDGVFSLDELADASLDNVGYTARELREAVVERCGSTAEVTVPPFESEDEEVDGLPGATVDISQACGVLAEWDGVYDLDSKGAALWREFMSRFEYSDLLDAGVLWATPFDPTKPLSTPNGLAPVVAGGQADLILENLARAVQALDAAGFDPDVELGEIQFSLRNGEKIPIHGGGTFDGTTNIVSSSKSWSIRDPKLVESKRESITNHSPLMRVDGESGYPITYGTSFLMALAYGENGPQAKVFLTYGNTEDRNSELYTAVTERFSKKNWRTVAFTPEAVKKDATNTITVKG